MEFHKKEEIITKSMAVIALATLIFMALSFLIVPNEGVESNFILKLEADEPRIQYVDTAAGEFTEFDMELYSTSVDAFSHDFEFQVTDKTYRGGSSAASWDFEFTDADDVVGEMAMYEVPSGTTKDVTLKVTFNGAIPGEMVTFTITGTEDDGANDTRLSPSTEQKALFNYISVVSNAPYNPYIEPVAGDPIDFPDSGAFSLTMWNLGSEDDTLSITGVNVYEDNGDGVFSPAAGRAGEDVLNTNFEVEMTTATGAPYEVGGDIFLASGANEQINVLLTPERDNEKVPAGEYFVQVTVDSINGDPDTTVLDATMETVLLADFRVLILEVDNFDVEEGDTIVIDATIGIDWDQDGEVDYSIFVDDELIEEGTVTFSASDNTKDISFEWETETGDLTDRELKVEVDPDDVHTESEEGNNVKTVTIAVNDKESDFPMWILLLAIGGVIVAGGAYWAYAGAPAGSVKIDDIIIRPDPPKVGTPAEIVAIVRNDGVDFEAGDKKSIIVSFYEDYESIGEQPVDLSTESFEGGSTREINLSWEPAAAGLHNLNVAIDIDDEESDVSSKDIEIGE